MTTLKTLSIFLLIAFAAMIYGCKSSTAPTTTGTYHIIPRSDSLPYAHSWADWQAKWWNWCYSIPANKHPLRDSGAISSFQTGSVWFLGGIFTAGNDPNRSQAVRSGTIPFGTAVFLPLLNYTTDTVGGSPPLDSLGFMAHDVWAKAQKTITADIDGNAVGNPTLYFVDTTHYTLYYGVDNILNAPNVITAALATGDYLFIDSLSLGQHTIHFHAEATGTLTLLIDVTYKLTVQ